MVVVAISGVPGVGKSTVGKILARMLNAKYIDISEFVKERKIYEEYDTAYQTYIVDEDKLIEELKKEITDNTVVEGHMAHLLPKDIVDIYIVLKADPNIIYQRLKERGYPDFKIFENIWAQNLEVIEDELESEEKKYYIIYTDNKSPEDVAKEILEIINKNISTKK